MKGKLKVLGAAKTVTGSKYLLSVDNFNILIDCGLYQGVDRKRSEEKDQLHFPASKIDAVVLTHAHLDHCGYIPRLVMDGFKGPILCTSATMDFARIILLDSAKIQLHEVSEAKKKNLSKNQIGEPLYYDHDVKHAMSFFRTMEHRDELKLGGIDICFYEAGHIPGAVSVGFKWEGGDILFSGDIGRYDDYMTFDPEVVDAYKNIVMETTYGCRVHSTKSQFDSLKEVLEKRLEKNGILLIPSFSLSRAQSLLLQLKEVFNSYPSLEVPVFVNSPMASEVTKKLIEHNHTIKQDISDLEDSFVGLKFTDEPWEVKSLYESESPKVIISASGMLTGGRVLNHLSLIGRDSKNIVFMPGYQAANTLGRDLVDGLREFKIEGQIIKLECEIIHSNSFSAHADQVELLNWIESLPSPPEKVFLIHGELESMDAFKGLLKGKLEDVEVEIPDLDEEFLL